MSRIEVEIRDYYVGGTDRTVGQLDIKDSDDFPLSVTYLIADIKNMSIRSGSYTKTFNVPATKNNNTILHDIWNPNTYADNISSYTAAGHKMLSRKPCIIKVDGVPILRGEIKVKNIITKGRKKEYVLQIIGDNADWVKQLENLYLNELTAFDGSIADSDHTFNQATIEGSWAGNYAGLDSAIGYCYFYPIINYGGWKNSTGVVVDDLRPAVYIKALLDAAFRQIEYKIDSTFLNTTDFKKLVMPYLGHGWTLSDTFISDRKFRAGLTSDQTYNNTTLNTTATPITDYYIIPFDDESTSPNFDTGSLYNNSTYKYIANAGFKTTFKGSLKITNLLAEAGTYTIYLRHTRGSTVTDLKMSDSISIAGSVNYITTSKNISYDSGYFEIQSGDEIQILIASVYNPSSVAGLYFYHIHNYTVSGISGGNFNTYVYNEIDKTILDGGSVTLADTLPDNITALDILKGLTHMFNLYFRTDVAMKTVYIEPRNSFYDDITTANDWSGKLNKADYEIKYIDDYKKEIKYGYKKDNADGHLKARDTEHDLDVGDYFYTLNDRFLIGKQEFINPTFAATYHIMDKHLIYNSASGVYFGYKNETKDKAPLIARMWKNWQVDDSSQNNNYDWMPRILVKSYGTQLDDDGNNRVWEWEGTSQTSIPTALMSGYADVTQDELEFTGADGLFQTYYGKFIKIIEKGTLITAMFKLQLQDLSELNLKKPVYIDKPADLNGYYAINKIIDYSPSKGGLTKVELIKIENLGTATLDATQIGTVRPEKGFGELEGVRAGGLITHPFFGGSGGKFDDGDILIGNDYSNPTLVFDNGSGNMAYAGSGSVVLGNGLISTGTLQLILGSYNTGSATDLFQIGTGTSDSDRITSLRLDADGNLIQYGGEVQVVVNDVVMDVLMEDEANFRYLKVFKSE